MTARATTLKGADAGVYYVEALPNYYLDSGEPAGRWHGRGAERLGLVGEVGDVAFLALMAGLDPRHTKDVPLGMPFNARSVRGFDVTASAPKSVSVLFAVGDGDTRRHVLAAHDTAVESMLCWVEDHAHTRFRINGEVAVVDAEGIIAATFRQHTSRALDPQLHTHVVISNKVISPDDRWLALDARTLKLDQRTLSAIYHATLRSELTGRLGVGWREAVNGIAEMAHIDDEILVECSSRTGDIQRRLDTKLDRFIDTFQRDPSPRERWRLEREAVVESRPAKAHSLDAETLHQGWADQLVTLGHEPAQVVADVIGRIDPRQLDRAMVDRLMADAIGVLSEKQSSWRPAELTRELATQVPTDIHHSSSGLVGLLDQMTRATIEQHCVDISRPIPGGVMLRRDGRPVTESVADRALTTQHILDQEHRLLEWADRRLLHDSIETAAEVERSVVERSEVDLTGPQAETAAAVAGEPPLVLVVGPAGTGKTTALRPAVEQLHADRRTVFGVAPSATSAEVLGAETGVAADTIDKLIIEHQLQRPPGTLYDLPAGSTIIVDEAGMLATDKLAALADLADRRRWRVALVGDPMQFSAVGRGGMFEHLINTHGAIELDQVHRFSNDWEAQASLRMRRGDPSVAEVYEAHGRLHGGTASRMQSEALDAWWAAREAGQPVVLLTPTNETVRVLNEAAQRRRLHARQLRYPHRVIEAGGYLLHTGDEIATRANNRQLRTDQGHMIRNRDQWTITEIHPGQELTITGKTGTIRLPTDYIQQHVELGYATTSHAAQARTVDQSILYLDTPTNSRGIYTPMTRGRQHSTAYIVTDGQQAAAEIFADNITRTTIDRPAHARHAELNHDPDPAEMVPAPAPNPPAPAPALVEQFPAPVELIPAAKLKIMFNRYVELEHQIRTIGLQTSRHRQNLSSNADELDKSLQRDADARHSIEQQTHTLTEHDKPFHRRRHQPEIAHAKQRLQLETTHLEMNRERLTKLQTEQNSLHAHTPTIEHSTTQRRHLVDQHQHLSTVIGQDREIRGRALTRSPSNAITNTIGEPPTSPTELALWQQAAGAIHQHRTAHNITDPQHTLGPTPDPWTNNSYTHTHHHARHTINDLHATLGIEQEPHPDIGISIDL